MHYVGPYLGLQYPQIQELDPSVWKLAWARRISMILVLDWVLQHLVLRVIEKQNKANNKNEKGVM